MKIHTLIYEDQTSVNLKVFVSVRENPHYTDEEECREIGLLTVPMPDIRGGTKRKVVAKFKFGTTKLRFGHNFFI